MHIEVITLFPDFFTEPLKVGLTGRSVESGRVVVHFVDPRAFTHDKHRSVDDTPYGGGGGMLLKPEPMVSAIDAARGSSPGHVILLSPQGAPLTQRHLRRFALEPRLILVTGRYEGFDERIRGHVDEEISLGDFVLTGGEYAALALIDGVVRLLPGTLGNEASTENDSFSFGLLEGPQYTRPADFRDRKVPEVLQSGDHEKVRKWRRRAALERTRARRPDLLEEVALTDEDRFLLEDTASSSPRVEVAVMLSADNATAKGISDLVRVAITYGVERVWLAPGRGVSLDTLTALAAPAAQADACPDIERVPLRRTRKRSEREPGAPRGGVVALAPGIQVLPSLDALRSLGRWLVVVARQVPPGAPCLGPTAIRERAMTQREVLCFVFGTATDPPLPPVWADAFGIPLRLANPWADLPLIGVVTGVLDRFRGEG